MDEYMSFGLGDAFLRFLWMVIESSSEMIGRLYDMDSCWGRSNHSWVFPDWVLWKTNVSSSLEFEETYEESVATAIKKDSVENEWF